jgi:hypothetical protein
MTFFFYSERGKKKKKKTETQTSNKQSRPVQTYQRARDIASNQLAGHELLPSD